MKKPIEHLRIYLIRISIALFWVVFLFILGISHVSTTETLNAEVKVNIWRLAPQGWGFFTKNPSEDGYLLSFKYADNGCNQMISTNNNSMRNWFGLSKNNRYLDMEAQKILIDIPVNSWKKGNGNPNCIRIDTFEHVVPKVPLKRFEFGKKYVFVITKPLPLAWVGYDQEKFKPFQYVALILEEKNQQVIENKHHNVRNSE